ncbi:MAG: response regulator [Pseudomonadota bacterium]|nr:response regulator [Pseudomonadota bacterium]
MTTKTCLIVEDSALIREVAARIVKDLGFEATEAATSNDGLARCREAKPDIVLLDWDLPSLAALEFLRGVGEFDEAARPPIVLCATENDVQQFALAKAAGAAFHVMKPFDAQSIGEAFADAGVIARSEIPKLTPTAQPRDRAAS